MLYKTAQIVFTLEHLIYHCFLFVFIKKNENLYVKFDGQKGEISYVTKASFFRLLTLFLKNIESKKEFEITDNRPFITL